jgi:formylglycine-generating enzyme required for sulfatase activity
VDPLGTLAPVYSGASARSTEAPTEPTPPSVPAAPQWRPQPPRRWVIALVVALALLALAAVVAYVVWPRGDGGPPSTGTGTGTGGGQELTAHLPPGCVPDEGAQTVVVGGRTVYDRVAYVLPDKTRLAFVLVPQDRPTDPAPFYLMRDKVTNRAFAQFAERHADRVQDSKWHLGASDPQEKPSGVEGYADHPVVRVRVDEAHAFARWVGGELPTARQWDKAGGRFDGAAGPFPGDGKGLAKEALGVGMGRLLPAGRAAAVEGRFGCRDMAGNGYEWTCSVYGPGGDEAAGVPFDNPAWNGRVSVRGMTYFSPDPFRFELLDRQPDYKYRSRDLDLGPDAPVYTADVGFRVALPVPAAP